MNTILSDITKAPYETSITAAFTAFGEWAGFLESLSPEIQQWIADKIPLQKQRIMDRRLRRCKRICRKGKFSFALIAKQVALDFSDVPALQADITSLLGAELGKM